MSQAYTPLDEWEVFSSAFEKFSSMVATLHDAQAQQLDHGQVEKFLDMSGRELLRRMFQGYLDHRATTEPNWESLEGHDDIIRTHRRQDCQRHLATLFGEVIVSRTSYGAPGISTGQKTSQNHRFKIQPGRHEGALVH